MKWIYQKECCYKGSLIQGPLRLEHRTDGEEQHKINIHSRCIYWLSISLILMEHKYSAGGAGDAS